MPSRGLTALCLHDIHPASKIAYVLFFPSNTLSLRYIDVYLLKGRFVDCLGVYFRVLGVSVVFIS